MPYWETSEVQKQMEWLKSCEFIKFSYHVLLKYLVAETGQEEQTGQVGWKWVPDAEGSADVAAAEVVASGGAAAGRQAAGLPTAAAAAAATKRMGGKKKKKQMQQKVKYAVKARKPKP